MTIKLFTPLKIKEITLKNRVVMSPMCQYSAADGVANDWHLVHYGTRAVGGCGAIIVEATAVAPEGRITYKDLGIWNDSQENAFVELVSFIEQYGTIPGIQLAHAGRKASFDLPWISGEQLKEGNNGWQTVSASSIPFNNDDTVPEELTKDGIRKVVDHFKYAAKRAIKAGFKILEIHAAHGYLIHQFLSPISNKRVDEYGGSFQNRIRLLLEIVDAISPLVDSKHSLWVRISATDWVDNGWNEEEASQLAIILKDHGVDLIDVSTGGNVPKARIPIAPNYQVPFANKIRNEAAIMVGAVGLITTAKQATKLLDEECCDLVLIGRELLKNPYFVVSSAKEIGDERVNPVLQYERGF